MIYLHILFKIHKRLIIIIKTQKFLTVRQKKKVFIKLQTRLTLLASYFINTCIKYQKKQQESISDSHIISSLSLTFFLYNLHSVIFFIKCQNMTSITEFWKLMTLNLKLNYKNDQLLLFGLLSFSIGCFFFVLTWRVPCQSFFIKLYYHLGAFHISLFGRYKICLISSLPVMMTMFKNIFKKICFHKYLTCSLRNMFFF